VGREVVQLRLRAHRTLLIVHTWSSSGRRRTEPGKITVKGARRASHVTRSALDRDLARFKTGALGGWPPGTRRAPRLSRRGAQLARLVSGAWSAPTPPWPEGPKSGTRRPALKVPRLSLTGCPRMLRRLGVSAFRARRGLRSAASQVRRAPRALEDVEKVLTGKVAGTRHRAQDTGSDGFRRVSSVG
jgi:hypothetical protein